MARFKPGESGNASGRPKGRPNKYTKLTELFEMHSEALVSKVIELALSGDPVSLRLCIERLMPKITDKPTTVVMPDLSAIETKKIIPELLRSLAGQELSVSDMKGLIDIFNTHDEEVHKENKKQEPLQLTTKDPVEAARQYQEIMQRTHV